ncbi:Alpha/beta hydrolase family [Carex littledalei]|uniref:Alpha/beta hydrolase family n=1 Tax=Carex littledalei TaxID=544730 RepID=A0A833QE47_9POAL|nr:Alpha/beta hydrolase family [Carex littledalei]
MISRVAVVVLIALLGWLYKAIQPPPPKICGSPNGPPVTSPRIQLRDGRFVAYKEWGVPKENARYKLILCHAFDSTKDIPLPVSQELVEELGIYMLSYDRAGYGESDPNPKRSVKSEALDIEELADNLHLGPKFYVMGVSMGGYSAWGCLKYIPHRLAGVTLVVPVINYWWPSFPRELSKEAMKKVVPAEQHTLLVAHYAPSLLYAWMTQKLFASAAAASRDAGIFCKSDLEVLQKLLSSHSFTENKSRQQGIYESIHRDLLVMFGNWEFDPMNITDPFPQNEGSVHLWQGYHDRLVRVELQRFLSEKLPWIRYHEVSDGGHMFIFADGFGDRIVKSLLLGDETSDV